MSDNIFSKVLATIQKFIPIGSLSSPTTQAGFSKLNGAANLSNGEWRDVVINGTATLGSTDSKTNFRGLIVANGNANVTNASFYSLEVNGSADLENTEIRNTLHINGNAVLRGCKIDRLVVHGKKTEVDVIDSVIRSKVTLS